MDSPKVLIWNVHGLNQKARHDSVRKVVETSQPAIVCLQETKLSHITMLDVRTILGTDN
jgi:exonuclease III